MTLASGAARNRPSCSSSMTRTGCEAVGALWPGPAVSTTPFTRTTKAPRSFPCVVPWPMKLGEGSAVMASASDDRAPCGSTKGGERRKEKDVDVLPSCHTGDDEAAMSAASAARGILPCKVVFRRPPNGSYAPNFPLVAGQWLTLLPSLSRFSFFCFPFLPHWWWFSYSNCHPVLPCAARCVPAPTTRLLQRPPARWRRSPRQAPPWRQRRARAAR